MGGIIRLLKLEQRPTLYIPLPKKIKKKERGETAAIKLAIIIVVNFNTKFLSYIKIVEIPLNIINVTALVASLTKDN